MRIANNKNRVLGLNLEITLIPLLGLNLPLCASHANANDNASISPARVEQLMHGGEMLVEGRHADVPITAVDPGEGYSRLRLHQCLGEWYLENVGVVSNVVGKNHVQSDG